jgi:hypothetical protein
MLLSSYRNERKLGESDEQLIDLFVLARELAHFGWYGQRPEARARSAEHFVALHRRILERCRQLK